MTSPRTSDVDALRACALFGICMVNIPFLGLPLTSLLSQPAAIHDRVASVVVEVFFQGKFFLLFSFLFGWGFGAQMASAERRGASPAATYTRRLVALALIGVAHAVLVFHGDILVLYALLGALSWPLRHLSARRLLHVSCGCIALAVAGLLLLASLIGDPATVSLPPTVQPGYLGSFSDAMGQRLIDWETAFVFILLFNGPLAFAAILAGLAAFKSGFFDGGSPAYASFVRILPRLIIPAIVGNIAYAAAVSGTLGNNWPAALGFAALAIGGPSLSALYLAGIVELTRRGIIGGNVTPAGRMSLTAYVAEGALAGLIFNGYGLGLYGQLGPFALCFVALAVFAMVHMLCATWSRFSVSGPLEIVLRAITHGRWPLMRQK